ncbi:MAG: hypothetical protein ACYSWW_11875 [Planctomycetota bacterium]
MPFYFYSVRYPLYAKRYPSNYTPETIAFFISSSIFDPAGTFTYNSAGRFSVAYIVGIARMAKKLLLAVLLLVLVEALYLRVDDVSWRDEWSIGLSFGLPFRSVKYGSVTGIRGPISEEEWTSGFYIDPALFGIDVMVVILLALLLVRCVPTAAVVLGVKGCVLGSVTGAALSSLMELSPESWLSGAVVLIVVLVVVPLTIYVFSFGHKWQKIAIIALSGVTVFTFCRALFVVEGLFDGLMEDAVPLNLAMVLRLLALSAVPVSECLVLMFLHRKVLPVVLRSRKSDDVQATGIQHAVNGRTCGLTATERNRMVRRTALYASLLAITLYVGCHFSTVRKMREDPFFATGAIWSELERLEVPVQNLSVEDGSELLETGCDVSWRGDVLINKEDEYRAWVKKHILVPWIQVEIHQKEDTVQINR